jgi:hypothetical protein
MYLVIMLRIRNCKYSNWVRDLHVREMGTDYYKVHVI